MLFPQFSPRPWALPGDAVLEEMRSYAAARSFEPLLRSLAYGPVQQGAPAGTLRNRVGNWLGAARSRVFSEPGPWRWRCFRMRSCTGLRIVDIFRIGMCRAKR